MDQDYKRSVTNYLVFCAAVCLTCSWYVGPATVLFVWATTAAGLYVLGKVLSDLTPPKPPHSRRS